MKHHGDVNIIRKKKVNRKRTICDRDDGIVCRGLMRTIINMLKDVEKNMRLMKS